MWAVFLNHELLQLTPIHGICYINVYGLLIIGPLAYGCVCQGADNKLYFEILRTKTYLKNIIHLFYPPSQTIYTLISMEGFWFKFHKVLI